MSEFKYSLMKTLVNQKIFSTHFRQEKSKFPES